MKDSGASMLEILIVLGAIAFLYWIINRKKKHPIYVESVAYDSESNIVRLLVRNTKPICYKLKSSIRFKDMAIRPQEAGMMTANANSGPQTTLLAENDIPITIGPNESYELSLPSILPKDLITEGAYSGLSVELKIARYDELIKTQIKDNISIKPTPKEIEKNKSPFIKLNERRNGINVGCSQTMLKIIVMKEQIEKIGESLKELNAI